MFSPSPDAPAKTVLAAAADIKNHAEIAVDPTRDLVTYTLSGFLDGKTARSLHLRCTAALAVLRCGPNQHLTIIDISAAKLQPQEVVEAFRVMLADPKRQARRLAVVVGDSLAKMQIRRVLLRDNVRYVATIAEAEAWLFS